ncbi:hypothetical protein EJV46_01525 [Roseococcus sp. SYP-B2431]|uniref:hypothetical protein n=1 Tax=Roseococcus sp. SYP-B2431 TaxID=2496640 RepID=UPI00103E741E|nr:hypothetical protein [Roseococcus sp. SYP-B2431]TCH99386.1 hypothetical protein EJV46_01525 [Roseococcus sp. SYP-B2431]
MRYVAEMQVAQNDFELGFPSINCCNAVIYATNRGLFGFHSYGGDTKAKWDERAALFAQFVLAAAAGPVTGSRLYSVTFVGRRGYSSPDEWREELVAYADALHFGGKLRGVDLSQILLGNGDSAYVRARRAGDKCEICCKPWSDADRLTFGVPNPALHQEMFTQRVAGHNQITLRNIPGQILTHMNQAGANRAHSRRLRGL